MPASLSTTLVGPFIEACRADPIQRSPSNSSTVIANSFARKSRRAGSIWLSPMKMNFFPSCFASLCFGRTITLISSKRSARAATGTISLEEVAKIPLVLPGPLNARRVVIDRTFAEAGLSLNLAAEAVTVASELSAVRSGAGSTIFNLGDMSGFSLDDFAEPVLIEPTFYLTCCLIWSNELPLTLAAEGVKTLLIDFLKDHIQRSNRPGASWLD